MSEGAFCVTISDTPERRRQIGRLQCGILHFAYGFMLKSEKTEYKMEKIGKKSQKQELLHFLSFTGLGLCYNIG